jgi:ribosomal protein S18 acetylase RimI-like enzyme
MTPAGDAAPPDDGVRLATPDDADAITDAHIRGWQTAYRGLVPDEVLDGFSTERRAAWWRTTLSERAPDEAHWTWVVQAPDGVAGFLDGGVGRPEPVEAPAPDGAGEVYAIYLRPERRGQGYGRRLFTRAMADLEARGFDPLLVWVFEANPDGRRFYEAAGFRPDGARHDVEIGEAVLPEIRYRLDRLGR